MATGVQGQQRSFAMEIGETFGDTSTKFDDDGRLKRTGTWITASAHIVTAVIGSGVLSLAWANAQLGWIAGPIVLLLFSFITLYASLLLTDCYRSPDPVHGNRNYTYMQVVESNLGGIRYLFCGYIQYVYLIGVTIGYTITASISMVAIKRSNCFHKNGHQAGCHESNNIYMIFFGVSQIILSQIPNFHKISGLSVIAAIMSFGYSTIAVGLSIAKIAGGHVGKTNIAGTVVGVDVTGREKLWNSFQAIGNIAFAYAFSSVIVEIQDTLRSSPPENHAMKKASWTAVMITTAFYMSCGMLGYAAFGNRAPGNFLTGFGFYEPFWLVNIGNLFVLIHLVGAYQVFCQPIFALVENRTSTRWPDNDFLSREYPIRIPPFGTYKLNIFRSFWRTLYIIFTTIVAMMLPFFNSILGLLGALTFWPLTVYFPTEMYMSRAKIPKFSVTWIGLNVLNSLCLIVSLVAATGSIQGIIKDLHAYKPFQSRS